jgi:hypothetical protein
LYVLVLENDLRALTPQLAAGLASVIKSENSLHLEDSLHLDAGNLQLLFNGQSLLASGAAKGG